MKKIACAGIIVAAAASFYGAIMSGCSSYYGSAGPSGIDTINRLPGIPLTTSNPSLVPVMKFPNNADTGISLHVYDSNQIKPILRWKPVAGATGYRVVLCTDKMASPANAADTLLKSPIMDDTTFTGNDSFAPVKVKLNYSTTYYWAVCAKGSGKQGWSPIRAFKTKADPLPALQQAYADQHFGMFVHFNMSTFTRYNYPTPSGEWELGNENDNLFHPDSLNVGQWADVAKSAHCKYVVMTTKHHGGFCLWPYQGPWSTSPHGITQSSWYGAHGQRNIVREFVDSVRSRGMEPGFYFSIRDEHNEPTIAFTKAQLTDLLTNYGDIKTIWFDGWGWYVGYGKIPYDTIANLVHYLNDSLNHHTIIVENNHKYKMWNTELVEYEIPIDGPPLAKNNLPSEGNEPYRADKCWFWHPMNTTVRSTQFVLDRITKANAVNASYLLDVTPDTTGLIPADQVAGMRDIGNQVVAAGLVRP